MTPLLRRLLRAVGGWILVVALSAVAVHPEGCGRPADGAIRDAAQLAVDWLAANVDDDGSFLYRYDRVRSEVEPGYNETRHAGVLWSLWQADRAGLSGAAEAAERGFARVQRLLVDTPVGPAVGRGSLVASGTVGLLVAALDERRLATGKTDRDELLLALGGTLVGVVHPDGSVSADIHVVRGPSATRSPFFTGEVMWALARLHLGFPSGGFDEAALRIRRYVVDSREAVEQPWPPLSDHWAAYAFETMDRWPDPPVTTAAENRWLDRQLGLFGLQVRYESQRRGGVTRITRGNPALAAGVGTLGEGIGNHVLHLERRGARSNDIDALVERGDCAAHLLVERQERTAEPSTDSTRTRGAWFRSGDTQMDDQQHALSALLLLEQVRRLQRPGEEAPS